eukprot:2578512-Ditylum_brightwellii.AAC.1
MEIMTHRLHFGCNDFLPLFFCNFIVVLIVLGGKFKYSTRDGLKLVDSIAKKILSSLYIGIG